MNQPEIVLLFTLCVVAGSLVSFCIGAFYGQILFGTIFKKALNKVTLPADELSDRVKESGLSLKDFLTQKPDTFEQMGKKLDEEIKAFFK
ncbi:hypothetical protein SAMN04515674_104240 [Pseudarcicella hirudinis]|uniref:Uncharacterized protein n=1 Tax=Pseudarcicella hirudinis TaxID=1079859 RepID=A0A1I5RUF5_9BACT|nr:hypothetical protein [Pseudarcicella hirudinis]SFP61901.1 hypothetical protein SAMN04515674_104240 [Pseudarcicella hirudinis]